MRDPRVYRSAAAEVGQPPAPQEPAWIAALRAECERTSQPRTAARLGAGQADGFPSAAIVNRVLRGTYPHPTARLQALVEGALLSATVCCPILGDLPRHQCIEHQGAEWRPTNQTRVALFRACRACANRLETAHD